MQVSANKVFNPKWSKDGARLFFLEGSRLMSATLARDPTFRLVSREALRIDSFAVTSLFLAKMFSAPRQSRHWESGAHAGTSKVRIHGVEDQHRFILHHQVMEKTTDDAIAVSIVEQTKQRFDAVQSVSMDKGFHSKDNQAIHPTLRCQ